MLSHRACTQKPGKGTGSGLSMEEGLSPGEQGSDPESPTVSAAETTEMHPTDEKGLR